MTALGMNARTCSDATAWTSTWIPRAMTALGKTLGARWTLLGAAAVVVGGCYGCRREAAAQPPERVVQEFVERMQRVHGDRGRAREAYELLWSEARANLAERAERASAVAGRQVGPEEMIAPSGFTLRFKPKRYEGRVQGEWALVTVTGEVPSTQRREVRCKLENGGWRVVLKLPPMPEISKRPDAGM